MVLQNNNLLVSFLYSKQRKDNLTIAYAKIKDFINPVNMVYSYEVAQTPQNKRLKGLLMDVRLHLRATVNALRRMVRMRKSISINMHSSDQNFKIKQTKCANKSSVPFRDKFMVKLRMNLRYNFVKPSISSCLSLSLITIDLFNFCLLMSVFRSRFRKKFMIREIKVSND